MSVRSMARVWESSRHAGSDLLMLLAIADFADDDGNAYPSVQTLAKKCRMQPRNAQYILRALEKSGELIVEANNGPHGSNLYRIDFDALGVQAVAGVQSLAGVQQSAPGGAIQRTKGVQHSAPEPSVNHQGTVNTPFPAHVRKKSIRDSADAVAASPVGFAEFWKAYPRKIGKGAAEKSWKRLKPPLHEVLQAVERALPTEQWRKDGGQFIPHPATWLNQRRWEDELETPAAGADWRSDPVFAGATIL